MKRAALFFGVNILILVMLSLVMNLLGIAPYMSSYGINYTSLMMFCLVWGMGGAFISLQMSKWIAKKTMGLEILTQTGPHGQLVNTIYTLARKAGLSKMPEVAIYNSPEVNAFATGPSKSNSLVAVSTGLMNSMTKEEVEGVLAHEVAHIANGDMVTMTLVQGVVNAFVMFFARIAAFAVSQFLRGDDEEGEGLGWIANMFVVMAFEMMFGLLAGIVVSWFSRFREFKADAGSAHLGGKQKMISALESLKRNYEGLQNEKSPIKSMQISSKGGMVALFSTHPSLDDRIEALKKL
ncbi:MAG: protease HtpX [Bacteriovoracaceae bacterium]|nr:protease HtpX [Bacteriovoracaceae bacterium]